MAVKAKFIGDGSGYLNGVPARDLDADEFDALTPEQQDDVRNSGLYRVADGRIPPNARPVVPPEPVAAAPKPEGSA